MIMCMRKCERKGESMHVDITGQRFGRLVVIKPTNKRKHGYVVWLCLCDCGKNVEATTRNLINNHIRSCGCLAKEIRSKTMREKQLEFCKKDCKEGTRLNTLKRKKAKNNTSGTKGVYLHKKKWAAYIYLRGKRIDLGYFDKKDDAIKARKEAEENYFKPILEKYKVK